MGATATAAAELSLATPTESAGPGYARMWKPAPNPRRNSRSCTITVNLRAETRPQHVNHLRVGAGISRHKPFSARPHCEDALFGGRVSGLCPPAVASRLLLKQLSRRSVRVSYGSPMAF